jgi:hypothetical protein
MAVLGNTNKYYGSGSHRAATVTDPRTSGAASVKRSLGAFYDRQWTFGTTAWGTNLATFLARGMAIQFNSSLLRSGGPGAAFSAFGIQQNTAGTISGQVTELTVGVPYAIVHLFLRKTGAYIASARADATGHYTFYSLDTTITAEDGYLAVALDPATGSTYDALAHDRLTP